MKRVSVIIPSYCRPLLLREAVQSVSDQTYPEWEVIVIDDGSTPPVDLAALKAVAKRDVVLLRNPSSLGQATSRERGERAATGDFIFHLDDDDRLAPDALARGLEVFEADPEVDIVFFNVKGFGDGADLFQRNQTTALKRVLRKAEGVSSRPGVLRFGRPLFAALLASVPIAFQRPMARRNAWREATELRRRAYGQKHPLRPPLRESEWSLYATATKRIALLTHPLYLQRCNHQGYFSNDNGREAATRARIAIAERMLRFSKTAPELKPWRNEIRLAAGNCYFSRAYAHFYAGNRIAASEWLIKALLLRFSITYLRFGLRMLLPRGWAGNPPWRAAPRARYLHPLDAPSTIG